MEKSFAAEIGKHWVHVGFLVSDFSNDKTVWYITYQSMGILSCSVYYEISSFFSQVAVTHLS